MAAHRYWRVKFIGSGSSAAGSGRYVAVNRMTFHSANGTSLATGGTPIATSNAGALYGPENAFDVNNDATAWRSADSTFPASLGHDFGVVTEVAYIFILSHSGYLGTDFVAQAGHAKVEVSDDGIVWVPYPYITVAATLDSYSFQLTLTAVPISEAKMLGTFHSLGSVTSQHYPVSPQPWMVLPGATEAPYPPSLPLFGLGRISGTLKVVSTPSKRLVRLFERGSGQKVREGFSGLDGTYSFDYLDTGRQYFAVGFDDPAHYSPTYNAAVADMLEAGP